MMIMSNYASLLESEPLSGCPGSEFCGESGNSDQMELSSDFSEEAGSRLSTIGVSCSSEADSLQPDKNVLKRFQH